MLYEIRPGEPLATLLQTFKEPGGKVDYVLMSGMSHEDVKPVYASHKEAAGLTIERIALRYPRSQTKGPTARREPEQSQGKLITADTFFAPGALWVPTKDIPSFPHFTDEERSFYLTDQNVLLHGGLEYRFPNYHYAFHYSPYALSRYDE